MTFCNSPWYHYQKEKYVEAGERRYDQWVSSGLASMYDQPSTIQKPPMVIKNLCTSWVQKASPE